MKNKACWIAGVLASGACAVTASAASAATIGYIDEIVTPADTQAATSTSGVVFEGLVGNFYFAADPYNNTAYAGIASYVAVTGGASATYAIADTTSFSLLWGTPDSYNTLAFYLDGALVDSVTGSEITGQPQYGYAAAYVTITTSTAFNQVIFSSILDSFEYAIPTVDGATPVPAPVPLPAAAPLLIAGLGALSFVVRRRKPA